VQHIVDDDDDDKENNSEITYHHVSPTDYIAQNAMVST
jgi:hypothetical protein